MKTFKEIRDEYGYVGLVQLVEPEYGGDYGYVIYYKPNHLAVLKWNKGFKTYEEAEEACLAELNEIIKTLKIEDGLKIEARKIALKKYFDKFTNSKLSPKEKAIELIDGFLNELDDIIEINNVNLK